MSKSEKELADAITDEQINGYEQLIDRLEEERKELQYELNRDYHEARRFVRSHPEEGVLAGLVGGLAVGFLLGKLLK